MATKLPIEMIPAKQWRQNARHLLTKRQWDTIRHQVYSDARFRCEACGATNTELHAHEVWDFGWRVKMVFGFIPWVKRTQKLVNIRCLCKDCHFATHMGMSENSSFNREAAEKQLARVNGWGRLRLRHEVSKAYDRVRTLNQHDYVLDIDYARDML